MAHYNWYDYFIIYIIFIKCVFIICSIALIYLNITKQSSHSLLDDELQYWRERTEFIFIALMSLLLLYLFYHLGKMPVISYETRVLLFMYGGIMIITARWQLFFIPEKLLSILQHTVSTSVRF